MRYTSNIVAAAALAAVASAGDAPATHGNPLDITYAATIQVTTADALSGAMKIAASPNGQGVNIQFSMYNLPGNGDLCTLIDCF